MEPTKNEMLAFARGYNLGRNVGEGCPDDYLEHPFLRSYFRRGYDAGVFDYVEEEVCHHA